MNRYRFFITVLIWILSAIIFTGCSGQNFLSSTLGSLGVSSADSEALDTNQELEGLEPLVPIDDQIGELEKSDTWKRISPSVVMIEQENTKFDYPVVINKPVQMYLDLFTTKQKKTFAGWLARSGRYREMMTAEFEKAGLPKDLIYLSMIESGYKPLAYSRARAVGLWQFMLATGRQYNLRVDNYVDERRDAYKSTRAAASYLKELYMEFGDWHLAVAAYNGGPGKIGKGLKRYKVDNFWDLASKKHLRLETKHYVPKLIAALLIAKEPEKYGFHDIVYEAPLSYESLPVGPGINLSAIALISNSTPKEIKNLNLELKKGSTPLNRSKYLVNVPAKSAALARQNISRLQSVVSTGYKTHTIKKGESLSGICKKYAVNKTTILKVNNLRSSKLTAGQTLRIPYSTVKYQILGEGESGTGVNDSLVLHRIRKGDTIGKIARKYHVPQEMIVSWNGLKNAHSIRAGQQLALYIESEEMVPAGKTIVASASGRKGNIPVIRATMKKKRVTGGSKNFHYYHVKTGDSLWTISRKFSASTSDIKKWNNLKSNLIHPGVTLKLKKG
jgi:membrane-bound lytic murein transglycosylase D